MYGISEIIYKGNISKDEIIEVLVAGKTETIKEGAQKIEIGGLVFYLQDGNLYDGKACGTPTRFINTGAFPTE